MARKEGIEMRRRILAVLRASDAALGAYPIIERLREPGRRLAPTTVYRTLAALVEEGLVHRIESVNAFAACSNPGHNHTDGAPVLSICDDCGLVEEHAAPDVQETVRQRVGRNGFVPAQSVIEVRGHCASCRDNT
ncbi:MAG: Fur family transcriptional regulator [Pseudomonadota bacterium]